MVLSRDIAMSNHKKRTQKLILLDKFFNTIQKIECHTTLNCEFRKQVKQLVYETQEELSNFSSNREKGQQHDNEK